MCVRLLHLRFHPLLDSMGIALHRSQSRICQQQFACIRPIGCILEYVETPAYIRPQFPLHSILFLFSNCRVCPLNIFVSSNRFTTARTSGMSILPRPRCRNRPAALSVSDCTTQEATILHRAPSNFSGEMAAVLGPLSPLTNRAGLITGSGH